jgi:hypothetical protein
MGTARRLKWNSPEYRAAQRRLFSTLLEDDTDGFARRAVAFKRVFLHNTDEERAAFAERLDRVPNVFLKEYIRRTGWHRSVDESKTSQATFAFRRRALARIASIDDERLRREMQESYRDENRE